LPWIAFGVFAIAVIDVNCLTLIDVRGILGKQMM
jgi:hypothetical protein